MSTHETRRVLEEFFVEHRGHWLAEDVEVRDMSTGACRHGRLAAMERIDELCGPAPSPVPAHLTVVAGDGVGAAEWTSSDAESSLAVAAFFDVQAGEIVRARLYVDRVGATTEAQR